MAAPVVGSGLRRSADPPFDRHADLTRIATLHVELVRERRRLEAEIETAHGVVLVEHVATPEPGRPASTRPPSLEIDERAGLGALVVACVKVESRRTSHVSACAESMRPQPFGAQGILPLRRVSLVASIEIAVSVPVVDVLGVQQAKGARESQRIDRPPAQFGLETVVAPAGRVVSEEDV